MTYKLLIEARTKSKAKILGIPVKSFLEGERYSVSFAVANLGLEPFPGGELFARIEWPTRQIVLFPHTLPKIMPSHSVLTKEEESDVLSKGYGLFFCEIASSDGEHVRLLKFGKNPIPITSKNESFGSVHGKTSEELYEFWGMLVAAISLLIIAAEKVVEFLLWLSSVLPKGGV